MTKPLEGIRVLEFGNFIAGPFCGMLLGDMGAEVIKIEPITGDMSRAIPPIENGKSASFLTLNRNKKSVVLNLKMEDGISIVNELIKRSDVIIENNRPGVMDRLGLGQNDAKKINSKIVYTSVSGFGQTGPLKNRAGVNLIIEALSGTLSVMGEKGKMPPRPGLQTADMFGALFAAYATLSGLIGKIRHNEGRYSDISLMEASIAAAVWETTEYLTTNKVPDQLGHSHRASAPYQLFKTKDEKYIAIGAPNDSHFKKLMKVLNCPECIDNKLFSSYSKRKENEKALVPIVEKNILKWNSKDLEHKLTLEGIPCGCVRSYAEALEDDHSVSRNIVVKRQYQNDSNINFVRNPVLMDIDGPSNYVLAPDLGEHTEEILMDIGISKQRYESLVKSGVTL